jgi:cation diffusion facilitator CzcD-associated flavoprotein CzcO
MSTTTTLPSVCVIGAGSSGLPVIKALKDRGIPVTCFERTPNIGGLWCIGNKPYGATAAYDSLHINTDTRMMEYRDLPMPADIPDYPGHADIHRYFGDYAERFGLQEHIRFETAVTTVRRRADGVFEVGTDRGGAQEFDVVVVANGHHWDPRWPEPYPGQERFAGLQMHSHLYRNPEQPANLRGQRVLVVGFGNSAMDIACELGQRTNAARCLLSVRRGGWVAPKWVFGHPSTRIFARSPHWLPWQVGGRLFGLFARLTVGTPMDYGLPRPDHRWLQSHPTISQDFYSRVGHGDVLIRPAIESFGEHEVRFVDGRVEPIDAVIWCTGYKVSFPFLEPGFLPVADNVVPVWNHMMLPGVANLFFVGLYQPLGSIMQPAEAQAKLIADYLHGEVVLPDEATMRREMQAEAQAMRRRYVASARHTMQVDFKPFLRRMERLREQGRRTARAHGARLPVPARARRDVATEQVR